MNIREAIELLEGTWNNTIPSKRLIQLNILRVTIPKELHSLMDSWIDAKLSGVQDNTGAMTVVLIHGIQTDGAWHKQVESQLQDVSHLNVKSIGYECVTAFQLFSPVRRGPIKKVTRDIRDSIFLDRGAKIVIVAHSFGTYIVSKILSENSDIEFDKIIFCGSIIPTDYRWDTYVKSMPRESIINDVGTRDFYPVLATFTSFGYGASGRKGFQSPRIKDRYFDYGHSDFFDPNHISKYWKPFLIEGKIVESEWDTSKPKTSFPILLFCNPWLGRTIFFGIIIMFIVILMNIY